LLGILFNNAVNSKVYTLSNVNEIHTNIKHSLKDIESENP